jgi:hypothetical protein
MARRRGHGKGLGPHLDAAKHPALHGEVTEFHQKHAEEG